MKHLIRKHIKEKVKDIPPQKKQEYSFRITQKIIEKFGHLQTRHIYISMQDEIDTAPLISHLEKTGKKIFTPDMKEIELQTIDIIIVPWRAFTQDGKRLGRGAWRYDKFLAHAKKTSHGRSTVVWICFPGQIVKNIPQEPRDILMDEVITTE